MSVLDKLEPNDVFGYFEEICNIPNLYRLRISSIEESEIDDKFIALMKKYPQIADHLHMPLQPEHPAPSVGGRRFRT